MQQSHAVIAQDWEESERGWGIRPDGFSLHLTMSDCAQFRKEYWDRQPAGPAPDEYSRESGEPFAVQVSEATFRSIERDKKNGGFGIWGKGRSACPDAQGLVHAA